MNEEKELVFPLCVFPEGIKRIISETHQDLNFPVNYIAASLFFAVSVAIGTTRILFVPLGWSCKCIMYMSLLGRPGAVKTHPMAFALAPFEELDKVNLLKYERDLAEYRKLPLDQRPAKPKARQFIVKDITIEGLAKVHKDNPRGICLYADELKSWVAGFDRYRKSGGDQQQWLSLYNGNSIVCNRKSQDDITYLPETFVNVIGSLQPGVLEKMFKGEMTDDGFLHRILFVNNSSEDEPMLWAEEGLPSDAGDVWKGFVRKVLDICGYFEAKENKKLHFSSEAWNAMINWQNIREMDLHEKGSDSEIAVFRKIETYAVRFCIVIHTIREASGEIEISEVLDEFTVVRATLLADYFFETAKLVSSFIEDGELKRKRDLFVRLKEEFTTDQALVVGSQIGLPRSTVFRYLREEGNSTAGLIAKTRHAHYERRF